MGHEDRAHALLSASSAHRWMNCTPSARLEEQFPDTTSDAAAEGTLAHELAELKVRNYFYSVDFGKRKLNNAIKKLKEHGLWKEEMLGFTDEYLDYIKKTALALPSAPYVSLEKQVDFSNWVPEGFGTADCLMVSGDALYVIDFKYGKGVPVSAEENEQMMLYAMGAYAMYRMLYPIKRFRLIIIQPRLTDGLSEWELTLEQLMRFGEYVKDRAALAYKGKGDFNPSESSCRFCRARAQCRARSDHNVKQAFQIGEMPPLITNAEVGERLQAMEGVVNYHKDLKEYALKECLKGNEISGWKAVEGRGSRDWTDMDRAFDTLTKTGVVPEEVLWERSPLSLAKVETLLGKKDFQEVVGSFVIKKPGSPTLVKESDKREAITNKITAQEAFQEEN